MIQKLWFYPPIAIARVGRSSAPLDNFVWGPKDIRPRGTGKTTIQPAETFNISEDGTLSSFIPDKIVFKDKDGWRRVCPFYELHGEWIENGDTKIGPITPSILHKFGKTSLDLKWKISVSNWKAYNYTEMIDDQINASIELNGSNTLRHILKGTSPTNSTEPLVPNGKHIELGTIQLTKPTDDNSLIRIRFTPPEGWVYGPTNLNDRLSGPAIQREMYKLDQERRILNPDAPWCHFDVSIKQDSRTIPTGEYATDKDGISLGMVDDICDGIISCSIGDISAFAWIVVGPPKINPDRRPFISLADTLTDRVKRNDVNNPDYVNNEKMTLLEIHDLFERIRETMDVMNVDAQNDRARFENMSLAQGQGFSSDLITEAANKAFPLMDSLPERPLPLTELGRQKHRRLVSMEVLEDLFRERPTIIEEMIRKPIPLERYYDRKMPAVMRGPDGYPLTITRRQYDLLIAWQNKLLKNVEPNT